MRRLIIILLVLVFLVVVAVEIYMQSEAFSALIRPHVMKPLSALLGPDIQVGRVKGNFIPLYVEIRDVTIPDARGTRIASVRKVRAYINPLPLIIKRISVPFISILEPRIHSEQERSGQNRLLDYIRAVSMRAGGKRSGSYRLYLRTIVVSKGNISFLDKKSMTRITATDLDMTALVDLAWGRVKFLVSSVHLRSGKGDELPYGARLKATALLGSKGLSVDSLELLGKDGILLANGFIGSYPRRELDIKVKAMAGQETIGKILPLSLPEKKDLVPSLDFTARVSGTVKAPSVDGILKLSGLFLGNMDFGKAVLTLTYKNGTLGLQGKNWKLTKGNKKAVIKSMDASLKYDARGIEIHRVDVFVDDLKARLKGRIIALSEFDAVLTAESSGTGKALSFFLSLPFEGRIGMKGLLKGRLASPWFEGVISALPLRVRGVQFDDVGGKISYREGRVSISSAELHHQQSLYVFDGSVDLRGKKPLYTATLKLLRADVPTIVSMLYRPLPLAMQASGELFFKGTRRDFNGSGYLTVEKGSAYGESFDKATVSVSVTPEKISFPKVVVYKGSGLVKADGWIGFNRTYSAALEARFVDLSEVDVLSKLHFSGLFSLDIESSGPFSDVVVKASLDVPKFSSHEAPLGDLTFDLALRKRVLTVRADLSEGRMYLAGDVALRSPYPWKTEVRANISNIDPFQVMGKKELVSRALLEADGDMTLRGTGRDFSRLNGHGSLRRLGITIGEYHMANDAETGFTVSSGSVALVPFHFSGPGTHFSVSGGATLSDDMNLRFTGSTDLSLLRILFKEIEHGEGSAELALTLKDDLVNPKIEGELEIKNGAVKVKGLPQTFAALNGKVGFDRERIVVDSLRGEIGGGKLDASGWVQLEGLALKDFTSSVAFQNVTVRYPEGLTSTLIGSLSYDGSAAEQTLSGDVEIVRARYSKRVEWKTMLLDLARGFSQRRKADAGWIGDTQLSIRFHGKENIFFKNNLAKMRLDMDILFKGTVNQPQILGRIETRDGYVYFRKNDFRILRASVDFVDPHRMNPVLDIQAETRVREYDVRLALSGTAEQSTLSLISDPPLSEMDILSLLALGRTSEELTGKESDIGMSEAASFATGQFQDILERRARSITGLDRFQLDPYTGKGDTSVPRVTVGKEVVENRLYVTYSSNVGTDELDQLVRIEYVLDRHLSVVGERDEVGGIGADIKFRFEFK